MSQTWTVDVDGKTHTVSVDHDWQSRRATIRVDGRIVVKPLSGDETEREVPIASVNYVVRRLENDTFDLDIPPESFLNRGVGARLRAKDEERQEKRSGGHGLAITVGIVVLTAVVGGLIRYGRQGFQYMRIPWQPYASADGTFKAKFPSAPKTQTESHNIAGEMWNVNSLFSEYKNHFYAVEYIDLRIVVVEANAQSVMERFFDGLVSEIGGKTVSYEKASLSRNPAINFVVSIPAGAGSGEAKLKVPALMRGIMSIRDRRLFVVWTLAAQSDPFSNDLREFIDGFEIPPPPERRRLVM